MTMPAALTSYDTGILDRIMIRHVLSGLEPMEVVGHVPRYGAILLGLETGELYLVNGKVRVFHGELSDYTKGKVDDRGFGWGFSPSDS